MVCLRMAAHLCLCKRMKFEDDKFEDYIIKKKNQIFDLHPFNKAIIRSAFQYM